MAKFRKISPKIWNDSKFREFSDSAKLLFFLLLTHPHTSALGSLRSHKEGLAAELGWSFERLSEAFQEVFEKGMVRVDERAGLIWLPNFIRYNFAESPNVIKSWKGALDDCPECPLKSEILQHLIALSKDFPKAFQEAFQEAFQKAMPNKEIKERRLKKESLNPPISPRGDKNRKAKEGCEETERQEIQNPEKTEEPDFEFMQLREMYDEHARPEGPMTGWIEYKAIKAGRKWPGICQISHDIMQRIDGNFWNKGYEPSLARYLKERMWEQPIKSREIPETQSDRSTPKTFAELEEERTKKMWSEVWKMVDEKEVKDGQRQV